MARDYEKKKETMRAYYRTPEGKAAHKRAHENTTLKKNDGQIVNPLKVGKTLVRVLGSWH